MARALRVVGRLRSASGNVIIFSSGHFLRVLAASWLGLAVSAARFGILNTASLSALGYEHDASEPVIRLWNDTSHLNPPH
jgi:probable phosphoglycerate mutase